KRCFVLHAQTPTSAKQDPGAIKNATVLGLPRLEVGDREQVAVVAVGLNALVDHAGGADEARGLDRNNVVTVLANDPIDRRVEMNADVLADRQRIPHPNKAAVIITTDLLTTQAGNVGKRQQQ